MWDPGHYAVALFLFWNLLWHDTSLIFHSLYHSTVLKIPFKGGGNWYFKLVTLEMKHSEYTKSPVNHTQTETTLISLMG